MNFDVCTFFTHIFVQFLFDDTTRPVSASQQKKEADSFLVWTMIGFMLNKNIKISSMATHGLSAINYHWATFATGSLALSRMRSGEPEIEFRSKDAAKAFRNAAQGLLYGRRSFLHCMPVYRQQ